MLKFNLRYMHIRHLFKLLGTLVLIILASCATYEVKIDQSFGQQTGSSASSKQHTLYLIGDAGGADSGQSLLHFDKLKEKLQTESESSTILFLGDNSYPKGIPSKNDPVYDLSVHRLQTQLDLVSDFKGRTIFIPGNHDYYAEGSKGLKRQEKMVEKALGKNSFLPEDGCPLEKETLSEDLVLIIVDSQWFLSNWDKDPEKNDDCDIKTREKFFAEFESLIKKNAMKTIVVAMHHPLFSRGPHGGQFKFNLIQSVPNLLRKTSGASPQDMQHPRYLELKKRLVTLSQYGERVIFASGHEHSLQLIDRDYITQIVSGSGSKTTATRNAKGTKFSAGVLGYARVDFFEDKSSLVSFYESSINGDSLVYSYEYKPVLSKKMTSNYQNDIPDSVRSSIYEKELVAKRGVYRWLWGDHYRKYYGVDIQAPTVDLDTLHGGLTPVRKGGGQQSRSLRLQDKDGREYVMRALKKSPTQFIQAGIFKDQYVEGLFEDTYTEDFLADVFTASHPFAPFSLSPLLDAIEIYHPNTQLFYIPKQKALGGFNQEFGDELYAFEERAASGHGNLKSFGYSNKLISSDDLFAKIRKTDDDKVDEEMFIRARLFDMAIGDWDRHEDQWRWAAFEDGKKTTYRPVPRDRDQAFSKYDGVLMEFTSRIIPAAKKFQIYDEEFRSLKWFNTNPYTLDKSLMQREPLEVWQQQARLIQEKLTDSVIDLGLSQMPVEMHDETLAEIKRKLKGRLKNLERTAEEYYNYLYRYPVVKGTDKDNYFVIERKEGGDVRIRLYNIKNDKKGSMILDRTYSHEITREIWIYGLDDKDYFEIKGDGRARIRLILVGGQNKDTYDIQNGNKVKVYDAKGKKNEFITNKGTRRLTYDYETNLYDYKKNKYSQNQLIPMIGYNPDDGFRIGVNNVFSIYGFKRNPFTQRHQVLAHYYFATNGFDISYNFEQANIFGRWNFQLHTVATSPNYSINFYGFGNETINEEDDLGVNYHRVRFSAFGAYPKVKWIGQAGASLEIGGVAEGVQVEDTEGRYVQNLPEEYFERQVFMGAKARYFYENYDYRAYPTLGMAFELESGWKSNVNEDFDDTSYAMSSLSLNHKLSANGKLVFATKLKGHVVFGDSIAFYNATSIGGKNGLRGYRNQRFTGNSSFYQNTDLRYKIKDVKTGLLPLQLGVFAGFDYGRVWLKDEHSNDWKTSYGGGFSLVGVNMINLNAALFNSVEGLYFSFGLGYDF